MINNATYLLSYCSEVQMSAHCTDQRLLEIRVSGGLREKLLHFNLKELLDWSFITHRPFFNRQTSSFYDLYMLSYHLFSVSYSFSPLWELLQLYQNMKDSDFTVLWLIPLNSGPLIKQMAFWKLWGKNIEFITVSV